VLRATQCREGWHLETEPVIEPDPATEDQRWWIEKRADAQATRDQAASDGEDTADLDELTTELDGEITGAGMRGNVLPVRPVRRRRTTRRRQDAAPLPRRKISPRTVGKTYTAPDGKRFRPSLFVTTSERFPRRLIEERRIRFVRVGRHVRIPESALAEFIAAGLVEPVTTRKGRAALWPTARAVGGASARFVN